MDFGFNLVYSGGNAQHDLLEGFTAAIEGIGVPPFLDIEDPGLTGPDRYGLQLVKVGQYHQPWELSIALASVLHFCYFPVRDKHIQRGNSLCRETLIIHVPRMS